jgi:tRNA (mo5U34)-methyltransferase
VSGESASERAAAALQAYEAERRAFADEVAARGLGDVRDLQWYHTVDLGDGLLTPGMYDLRGALGDYPFPAAMHGRSVLDVGAATGFFAFELERRGARVVALELPSLAALDRFHNETFEDTLRIMTAMTHHGASVERPAGADLFAAQLYRSLLRAPFEFCAARLRSAVERRFLTVYDVSPATAGRADFDLVFVGDVLLHTLDPIKALAALASVCAGELVIVQKLAGTAADPPALAYVGGDDPRGSRVSWWLPNFRCLHDCLRKLGFSEVEELGRSTVMLRPAAHAVERTVVRARR